MTCSGFHLLTSFLSGGRFIWWFVFSELIMHGELGGILVIVTGRICMYNHLFGHITLIWWDEVEVMSLVHDGGLL